jgi:Kef-type K+ transport system membrane component KefB
LQSLRLFSAFFIPFYFFKAGLSVNYDTLITLESFAVACAMLVVMIPLRLTTFLAHGHFVLGTSVKNNFPVALSLLPTLVFGLVLINILATQFEVPLELMNGLVIYTLVVTLVPRFFLDAGPQFEPVKAITHSGQAYE